MFTEKYVFVKKLAKHGFATASLSLKHSPEKKKFRAQYSVKKVMVTVFDDKKGPITVEFLPTTK